VLFTHPTVPWPEAASRPNPGLLLSADVVAIIVGFSVDGVVRAIGWIIEGFAS